MTAQVQIRKILIEELARIQTKNPGFSLRSFAKKLSIAPSALSEIISGKRKLTAKASAKILERLMVDPEQSEALLKRIPDKKKIIDDSRFVHLDIDHYHVVSEWHYFAILSLIETEPFESSPEFIARRLALPVSTVAKAIDRLLKLELVEVKADGKTLQTTGVQFRIGDQLSSAAIRKQHHQNLHLASESLDRDPMDVRDFSSVTMAIDPDLLPEAKGMIKKFRRELCAFLESGSKKEVYKINVQLFPISKRECSHV